MWFKPVDRGSVKTGASPATATLADSNGERVRLGSNLGGGKEGEVYEVLGSRYVAKVFRPPNRTQERERKLRLMVAHPPVDPTLGIGHVSICWPLRLLFEPPDRFAGFLMPRVDTASCPQLLRFVFPKYYPRVFSWRNQLEIAANLAGAVAALHDAGYVVGDLNLKNIHVTRSCLVTSVDCDSFQVPDLVSGRVLRCTVGVPEYMAPEFQGLSFSEVDRTASSDVFAFSVILCQLLLAGIHPFVGGCGQTREENIGVGDSIFQRAELPRGSPPLEVLPPPIFELLKRCFGEGHRDQSRRPTMREYAQALQEAREQIQLCELEPERHTYGSHLGSCPWCEIASEYRFDPYRNEPPKPKPLPSALTGQQEPGVGIAGLYGHYRRAMYRHRLRRAVALTAVLLACVLLGLIAWNVVETRLPAGGSTTIEIGGIRVDFLGGVQKLSARIREGTRNLWNRIAVSVTKPASVETAAPAANVKTQLPLSVDTPVLCYGLNSRGEPLLVSGPVYEEDTASRTLKILVRFQNAIPGKTSLQVRWLIAGRQELSSNPFTADSSEGAILVPYRGRIAAGSSKVAVFADGIPMASLVFTVSEDRKKERSGFQPAGRPSSAPETLPQSPALKSPVTVEPPTVITLPPRQPWRQVFKTHHKHSIGACYGELILEAEKLTFTSAAHTFRWTRDGVVLHGNGLEDSEGKRWHFTIEGRDVRELLSRWLRGDRSLNVETP